MFGEGILPRFCKAEESSLSLSLSLIEGGKICKSAHDSSMEGEKNMNGPTWEVQSGFFLFLTEMAPTNVFVLFFLSEGCEFAYKSVMHENGLQSYLD